ncbi:protein-export chaperone SecB [Siculibacillus lacustris]|uniref:Protein-export protein SecB n=1 Tax=Siculibacillus lacustris TaxID=1549641 RepID=A0A4Q9VK79_9HYPH|nr:protein-export chaperone SecB [Siculibacillus lacustris]TBW35794.1 protein-export chaperone SecB [Siculibacillus lacustris]
MTDASNATPPTEAPSLNVLAQYVKDLSFENPNAPNSLAPQPEGPQITINVNVGAQPLSATEFEVELKITAQAGGAAESVLFNVELLYAGLFRIQNVPEQHLHPFVLIECPRLLFPFARAILADATRNGGFPPLMLDPIDFVALYQQNAAQTAAAGAVN